MEKNYLTIRKLFALLFTSVAAFSSQAQSPTVQVFPYTGSVQTFTVPPCVNQMTLEVWGAEGGGSSLSNNSSSGPGGKGGYAKGTLTVVSGSTLNIYVGGYGLSATSGSA